MAPYGSYCHYFSCSFSAEVENMAVCSACYLAKSNNLEVVGFENGPKEVIHLAVSELVGPSVEVCFSHRWCSQLIPFIFVPYAANAWFELCHLIKTYNILVGIVTLILKTRNSPTTWFVIFPPWIITFPSRNFSKIKTHSFTKNHNILMREIHNILEVHMVYIHPNGSVYCSHSLFKYMSNS